MKPYDKIPNSECPKCGQELLYKGTKKFAGKTEIMWGCCDCEIEGGYLT
jgi:ssDNA-binding Zn-finger/Zn-ribbon topoisomerase 1